MVESAYTTDSKPVGFGHESSSLSYRTKFVTSDRSVVVGTEVEESENWERLA